VRLLHAAAKGDAAFDDENFVSAVGLAPIIRLAWRCGLAELVAGHVDVDHPCGATLRSRLARSWPGWPSARTALLIWM
jgi:hypothetical protein